MLVRYWSEALKQATHKLLADGSWFAEVPGLPGAWASGVALEETRDELFDVVQEWLLIKLRDGDKVPVVAGIDLNTLTAA